MASNDIKSELESFREQWRAEVRSKVPSSQNDAQQTVAGPSTTQPRSQKAPKSHLPPKLPVASRKKVEQQDDDDDDESVQPPSFDEPEPAVVASPSSSKAESNESTGNQDLSSALEHYEQAVEKEAAGNLGDSLRLYRKAYRMDHRVDLQYRKKHFPAALAPKPTATAQPNPSNAAPTVPNPAHHSLDGSDGVKPQSLKELIASFAGLTIQGAPPEIEGIPPAPCPISELPDEILVHILRDVAVGDIASFVRLARVCKRLAYLVATEDQIWRRVCLGDEFGFGGMHYRWQTAVAWGPLDPEEDEAVASGPRNTGAEPGDDGAEPTAQEAEDALPLSPPERGEYEREEKTAVTLDVFSMHYASSWQRMFRTRPRIRFGGCYISTVNYLRSGQASANATTWHSPVHIVTYYRYLRFFRDGTAISLLTTAEPADVVHHLTREAVRLHRAGAMAHLPSVAMQSALKGRWRLACARDYPDRAAAGEQVEGDVFVETEGVGKYMYRLDLSLGSGGKRGPRNNKLVWRGFYSYNRMTDDWSEFGMKNYKPFYFSRVRSYGMGE